MLKWLLLLFPFGFLGFFGQQAIRLLRENWDGILHPEPVDGSIRPHGAKDLAEELFAMFDDSIPQTQNGPVTINSGNGPGLTINAPVGGHGLTLNGGNFDVGGGGNINLTGGNFNVTNGSITLGGNSGAAGTDAGRITIVTGDGNPGSGSGGTVQLGGFDFRFTGGTLTFDDGVLGGGKGTDDTPLGRTVFLGKIQSGTGRSYMVQLYGNGSAQAVTATVAATVPQLADDEHIPAGTWVAAVHKFTVGVAVTYEFQPPIWLA